MPLLQSAYLPEEDEDCRQKDAALPDSTPQGVDLSRQPLLHHLWRSQHLCCKQASCTSHSACTSVFLVDYQAIKKMLVSNQSENDICQLCCLQKIDQDLCMCGREDCSVTAEITELLLKGRQCEHPPFLCHHARATSTHAQWVTTPDAK